MNTSLGTREISARSAQDSARPGELFPGEAFGRPEFSLHASSAERAGSSMQRHWQQSSAITAGIWLIGLGILFATRFWWPGILILVAVTSIVQGWSLGRPGNGLHVAFWMILIAVWAMVRFSTAFLFIALGLYVIFSAMVKPEILRKPYVDNTLE
jgi:hypothetical protein